MESKSYQRFRSRVEYIHQHLQVLDAAVKTLSGEITSEKDKTKFITDVLNLDKKAYNKLAHPISQRDRIISYSRSKSAEYTILELFSSFTHYMRDITEEMYKKDPIMIVGKVNDGSSLTYVEIIKLGTFEKIGDKMVNELFRKFENERSTTKLVDKILNHTKITIPKTQKETALMYLEMRHLFIHNKGKADDKFIRTYGKKLKIRADGKLPTNFKTISTAIEKVRIFTKSIDDQLISGKLLDNN